MSEELDIRQLLDDKEGELYSRVHCGCGELLGRDCEGELEGWHEKCRERHDSKVHLPERGDWGDLAVWNFMQEINRVIYNQQ